MTSKVNALFVKLLTNTRAIDSRHAMAAQIERRGLSGIHVGRVLLEVRRFRSLTYKWGMKNQNNGNRVRVCKEFSHECAIFRYFR